MADTGATYPGTAATEAVTPEDDYDWTNPDNIKADDGSYAECILATGAQYYCYRLKATNFSFSLPTGSTIDGILVEIKRREIYFTSNAYDYRVQLLDGDGNLVGDNKPDANEWLDSDFETISYGGAADKWNASPTEAMVESANFGVVLSASVNKGGGGAPRLWIDFIRITVYYTPPIEELAATIAGSSSVSASLAVDRALAATIQGEASVSGALAVDRALAARSDGAAIVTANLSRYKNLAGLITGEAQVEAAIAIYRALSARSDGVCSVSALMDVMVDLAAQSNGVCTVTAALSRIRPAIRNLPAVRNLTPVRVLDAIR